MNTEPSRNVKLFEHTKIRSSWNEDEEKLYFSVVDVIEMLTDSERPRKYWSDLKAKLIREGSQLTEQIGQLKMEATDGKLYLTDVVDTEQLFRLIQSIPSPKAEPLKQWLAKAGCERMEEAVNPKSAISRAIQVYLQKGFSEEWIKQRLKNMEIKKELVQVWGKKRLKKGQAYSSVIDMITLAWNENAVTQHQQQENYYREDITNLELAYSMLSEDSEISTLIGKEISEGQEIPLQEVPENCLRPIFEKK